MRSQEIRVLDVIAFDADDTLWHNEHHYVWAQDRLQALLSGYYHGDGLQEELDKTELANIPIFGYGTKSFGLSMIETAIRLAGDQIRGGDILKILQLVKEMLRAPVELLDHVAEVIPALAASHTLMVITKGDLLDQERKIASSGLAHYFAHVEVVSDKTVGDYRSLFDRLQIDPRSLLMVGNSLRSDILPVVSLGSHAVHVPYAITWQHETVSTQDAGSAQGYVHLEHLGLLPAFVEQLEQQGT